MTSPTGARLPVLFFAAYGANIIPHETSHALTAMALGVPSTLFHFYVDLSPAHGTPADRALIAVVGPLVNLVIGAAFWVARTRVRERPAELPFLYVATFGVSMFLGNLVSIAFVGDFSRFAQLLGFSEPLRYAIALSAVVALCTFTFRVGKELTRWAPPDASRWEAGFRLVAVPVVIGTALVLLAFIPMPRHFVVGWLAPSMFWIFAAMGVLRASRVSTTCPWGGTILTGDVTFALAVAVVVRILSRGLTL